jgi:microcystin synthetase protein McyA
VAAAAAPLPTDTPAGAQANTLASTAVVSVDLDREQTAALLREVPPVYNTQINDLLLAALGQALADWSGRTRVLIDIEGHGREELFADIDLSRTVGWFTAIAPLALDLEGLREPGARIKSVKEQVRQVPQRGVGYGLLRYLGGDGEALEAQAPLLFNYLGQIERGEEAGAAWRLADEPAGAQASPRARQSHLLVLNAHIADGALTFEWSFSTNLYRRATVERLAAAVLEELRALIRHCLTPEAGGVTVSDFPLVQFDDATLDDLLDTVEFEE